MKFHVGMRLAYRDDVSDYVLVDAEDSEDAKAKMYEYLKKRLPATAIGVKVDYVKITKD